jgi:hypothetical protein
MRSTKDTVADSRRVGADELGSGAQHNRPSTWSVIVRAQGTGPEARHALGELIQRYERSVVAIVRAFGYPRNSSPEDLKQEFFLAVIRRDDIAKLDRTRGRFRDWLRVAVENFLRNAWATWHAEIHGNHLTDLRAVQALHSVTPEHLFMRQFAEDTLLHALQRHRELTPDKTQFDRWLRLLPGPQLDIPELASLAAEWGMPRNRAAVRIHRMRERHRRILREVVADTLDVDASDPEGAKQVALEMGLLYRALCDTPPTQVMLEHA